MSHSFDQFQGQRDAALQDAASKLATADRDKLLVQAILGRYSHDRPVEVVSDVTAPGGTHDMPLPTDPNYTFEDGFSWLTALEFPAGVNATVPATYLLDEDFLLYRNPPPTGLVIRMLPTIPNAGDTVRVTWTARHKNDGSTVYDSDFEAVCDFAASLCMEALASIYTQTGDSTISADTVNYRTKAQEYLTLAKAARQRYFNHMGIDDPTGGAQQGAVIAIGSQHEELGGLLGIDRLTHPRSTR
jgi:hypothetical protein